MRIRPFKPEDEPAVVALWQECRLTRPWNDPHKDIVRKLAVQPELFFLSVEENHITGTVMAGYEGHRGWVNYLAVAPAFRGRGFARALMEHVERELVARGCPKLSLLVRTTNHEAIAFYRHLGYVEDESVSLGKRLIAD
jgi:ribosomal protein S18 acetylase RimI-like enzyme